MATAQRKINAKELTRTPSPRGRDAATHFSFKAIAVTVIGTFLTLLVGLVQAAYSDHLNMLRRQAEQGSTFQEKMLAVTGRLLDEYNVTIGLAKHLDIDGVVARHNGELDAAIRAWDQQIILLRNEGSLIYGDEVGSLIFDIRDDQIAVDICGVVDRDRTDDPTRAIAGGENQRICYEERPREALALKSRILSIRGSASPEEFGAAFGAQRSLYFNARILEQILGHYISCERFPPSTWSDLRRCGDRDSFLDLLAARATLLDLSRTNIANAIVRQTRGDMELSGVFGRLL